MGGYEDSEGKLKRKRKMVPFSPSRLPRVFPVISGPLYGPAPHAFVPLKNQKGKKPNIYFLKKKNQQTIHFLTKLLHEMLIYFTYDKIILSAYVSWFPIREVAKH